MDILFGSDKLAKNCNEQQLAVKKWGSQRARVLRRRLDMLAAVESLDEMRHLPGRTHQLSGNRKDQLSIDLDGPYRLIFKPAHDPAPQKDDGGLDWCSVTAVQILGVEDTHD